MMNSMDFNQALRSRIELSLAVLGTIVGLVLVREVGGYALGNTTGWRSWVGLISGLLGAATMVTVLEVLVDIEPDELAMFRQVQYVHVIYGAVAGGLYPALVSTIGFDMGWATTFPRAVLGSFGYTVVLFALGMVVYTFVGAVRPDRQGIQEVGVLFGLYVLYAIVFGVSMSLTGPVWFRLFGL